MNQILPVILAGGGGTRLWPLSRGHYPKQFLAVDGDTTLLQGTLKRLTTQGRLPSHFLPPMVVCNEEHRFLVGEQARQFGLPFERIVLEPLGRNTAPALTCAALAAIEGGHDPQLLMMPADHLISDAGRFMDAIHTGSQLAAEGRLVTFGVVPTAPETGYGYIQLGTALSAPGPQSNLIAAFKEKPARETAEAYLATGQYRWNAGIFLMKASAWLEAIESFRPDILAACRAAVTGASRDGEFLRLAKEAFTGCPSDSIDYAVMEPIATRSPDRTAVVSLEAGWSDVGSWSSLWEVSPRDVHGNVTRGDVCAIDCKDNLIFAQSKLVAAVGCEDLVIVETPDAVMVAPKARAQDVKAIVDWLAAQGREERLLHRRVYRPWGTYEGVDTGERFQVKRIMVKPGASLSLQMHHHRAEHWIVVKGTARVTRGEDVFLLTENQSTYIPLGETHRLENPGTIPLEIVEVQSGAYLGEDDIVRFEDKYKRA
ncbi:MAG: mannose-1-phosphate guanylyltransferase/mannose-6-phosphate isomerase [Hydrogenophaga sp.]|uniref:mannose-1-phosphate guanylyltransferase/mannose-6-phosphate isomerase n=1 Tax=Hydrogenophaga sp. TaxID=1904254 RepID=UPI003D0B3A92